MPGSNPGAGRHRYHRQSAGAQGDEVREIIEAAGAMRYLPPYSPDLNPIEQGFSKLNRTCESTRNVPFPISMIESTRYRHLRVEGIPKLLQKLRIRTNLIGFCSNSTKVEWPMEKTILQ